MNRRPSIANGVFAILILAVACTTGCETRERENVNSATAEKKLETATPWEVSPSVRLMVNRIRSIETLHQTAIALARIEAYLAPAILRDLAELILSTEITEFVVGDIDDKRHDLRMVGGRAAVLLENVLGLDLPIVREVGVDSSNRVSYRAALSAVTDYSQILITERNKSSENDIDKLATKFGSKLAPNGPLLDPIALRFNNTLMAQLLSEWFPIGRKLSDLESIIGVPTIEEDGAWTYTFDGFFMKVVYEFYCKDDVIQHVRKE